MNVQKFYRGAFDMSKLTVQIFNEFHRSTAYMTVNGENDTVSADEVDRVAQELCGMENCKCHSVPTNGDCVVDTQGHLWRII